MQKIGKAIPWAAGMLLIAFGAELGLVDEQSARTMFAVIPALAVVSIARTNSCRLRRAK